MALGAPSIRKRKALRPLNQSWVCSAMMLSGVVEPGGGVPRLDKSRLDGPLRFVRSCTANTGDF